MLASDWLDVKATPHDGRAAWGMFTERTASRATLLHRGCAVWQHISLRMLRVESLGKLSGGNPFPWYEQEHSFRTFATYALTRLTSIQPI